ncbi:hypothetical protein SAMN05444166_5689 [Singulisphaera sp. GP187]|uniref:hypothetical protein n=1 Tax=Singulisphaera sp. GP187 TaxID=1882752 RepID=UPI0009264CA1|nr:hypothetical protein [Singulisphaera sp. GP187]SIO58466.1 hypothetical protein SAMN05444166_5689 [Singulisphaera sp. GP187]
MNIILAAAPVDKPRLTTGRFASPASPWAITEVLTPHYEIGYRVGPNGRIYASKAAAERFALARQNRLVRPN